MTGIDHTPTRSLIAPTQPPAGALRRRAARWLWLSALLALAPKCVLCVLAYAGLGTALGLSSPELCGAPVESTFTWTTALTWIGFSGALAAMIFRLCILRKNPAVPMPLRSD